MITPTPETGPKLYNSHLDATIFHSITQLNSPP